MDGPSIASQEQEIDQAVLQRRLALFDTVSDIQRIDPSRQQGQNHQRQVPADPAQQQQQAEPATGGIERDEPMVDQGRDQKKHQNADRHRDQGTCEVDQLELPASLVQLPLDQTVAGNTPILGRRTLGR